MSQAIQTKYLGPTNTKGSRIKATCFRGSLTVSYQYDLDERDNHKYACDKLCAKFDDEDNEKYEIKTKHWGKPKAQGGLKNGHVFVFTD